MSERRERAEAGGARRAFALLGLPGAGKGSQAAVLRRDLGIGVISTGELFRDAIRADDALGATVAGYVERGDLVPDDVTMSLIRRTLGLATDGWVVFDGMPRTLAQARALDEICPLDGAIDLVVDHAVLERRLASRRVCSAAGHPYAGGGGGSVDRCAIDGSTLEVRRDDQAEVVRRRIEQQARSLEPVRTYYRATGRLHTIDGARSVDEVTGSIIAALDVADPIDRRPRVSVPRPPVLTLLRDVSQQADTRRD